MTGRRGVWKLLLAAAAGSVASGAFAGDVLPAGGSVVAGSAAISAPGSSGLLITQSSDKAIIDWSGFSISAGNTVQFNNGSGSTLNRVTGPALSAIDGGLSATGSVYLINPNGVIIGKDGRVTVGGSFVASSLDETNANFLAGGDQSFAGNATGAVVNLGAVGALGGDVALIARTVDNAGTLTAPNGTVGLIAGTEVLMRDLTLDDGKFSVVAGGSDTSVTNTGSISAAAAELRANGGNVYALAGNTGGVIKATGVTTKGGRVFLTAPGGAVKVSGTIKATQPAKRQGATKPDGGRIVITGGNTMISGLLDASGDAGGFIETSGDHVDFGGATITAGTGGSWLVDPDDLHVDASAAQTILLALNSDTNVTLSTNPWGTDGPGMVVPGSNGDIFIDSSIGSDATPWHGTGTLDLIAYRDIYIDAPIVNSGSGLLVLRADNTGTGAGTVTGTDKIDFARAAAMS